MSRLHDPERKESLPCLTTHCSLNSKVLLFVKRKSCNNKARQKELHNDWVNHSHLAARVLDGASRHFTQRSAKSAEKAPFQNAPFLHPRQMDGAFRISTFYLLAAKVTSLSTLTHIIANIQMLNFSYTYALVVPNLLCPLHSNCKVCVFFFFLFINAYLISSLIMTAINSYLFTITNGINAHP